MKMKFFPEFIILLVVAVSGSTLSAELSSGKDVVKERKNEETIDAIKEINDARESIKLKETNRDDSYAALNYHTDFIPIERENGVPHEYLRDVPLDNVCEEEEQINGRSGYVDSCDNVCEILARDGRDGMPGKDGKDGANGTPGRDGKDGANGLPGINGLPGRNGVNGKDCVQSAHEYKEIEALQKEITVLKEKLVTVQNRFETSMKEEHDAVQKQNELLKKDYNALQTQNEMLKKEMDEMRNQRNQSDVLRKLEHYFMQQQLGILKKEIEAVQKHTAILRSEEVKDHARIRNETQTLIEEEHQATASAIKVLKEEEQKELIYVKNQTRTLVAEEHQATTSAIKVLKEEEKKELAHVKNQMWNLVAEERESMENEINILKKEGYDALKNVSETLKEEGYDALKNVRKTLKNEGYDALKNVSETLKEELTDLRGVVIAQHCTTTKIVAERFPMGKPRSGDPSYTFICPTRVAGFRINAADSMTGIQLKCTDGANTEEVIGYSGGSWKAWKRCNGKAFVTGVNFKTEPSSSGYTYGSNVNMICSDGEKLHGEAGSAGSLGQWEVSGFKECQHGHLVCGLRVVIGSGFYLTKMELLCCQCKLS